MSQRPGFIVQVDQPTENGGVSPNAFRPFVSVQIRVHAPFLCRGSEVREALSEAFNQALDQIEGQVWR